MNIIGFAFTKLNANRAPGQIMAASRTNNLEIVDIQKQKAPAQIKDQIYHASFRYQVIYGTKDMKKGTGLAEILIEGYIILSMNDKEAVDFDNSWKKKQVPDQIKQPILNLVLKRCTPKALEYEDTLGLPYHIPIPQVKLNKKD